MTSKIKFLAFPVISARYDVRMEKQKHKSSNMGTGPSIAWELDPQLHGNWILNCMGPGPSIAWELDPQLHGNWILNCMWTEMGTK